MELIDRVALEKHLAELAHFNRLPRDTKELSVVDVEELIDHQRTVNAAPVVHAYWRRVLSKGCRNPDFVCNACDSFQMHVTKYCPNCGAFMDAAAAARAGKDGR